ncbi:MAG: IS3 family transposase [Myxococcota bacterium]
MSAFELIRSEAGKVPVTRLCELMGVSRAGYYAWRGRGGTTPHRHRDDRRIAEKVRVVHAQTGGVYGSRRMRHALSEEGLGRHRLSRIMRENGLQPRHPRRFRITTVANPSAEPAPNLLAERPPPPRPNEAWVGDLTYVWTAEGWCYLAVLYSRRVVGWAFDRHMKAELATRALSRAVKAREPARGLIHHSDRGSPYTSGAYQRLLEKHGAVPSMSGVGNCYDNAVAESFFATLKKERLHRQAFATRTEAYDAIAAFIDGFYNPIRLHSSLNYLSPIQYELQPLQEAA